MIAVGINNQDLPVFWLVFINIINIKNEVNDGGCVMNHIKIYGTRVQQDSVKLLNSIGDFP